MKLFDIFRKKNTIEKLLTLEKIVEIGLITKEEMLFLRKERAEKEWENEIKLSKKK